MGHKKYYVKAGFLWLSGLGRQSKPEFTLGGNTYSYFHHRYNFTWLNERCVEIPIIREILSRKPSVRLLEVGNVLSHYDRSMNHAVVDKYEKAKRQNLFTEDAETFSAGAPYDLIVSISTLEHVGHDETPRDADKIFRTVRHLRSLLSSSGELVFTAPVGYSPSLDRLVDEGDGMIERLCLRRINAKNEWEETDWDAIKSMKFHDPYPFASGLVVARMRAI
jgi:hypothetical protein